MPDSFMKGLENLNHGKCWNVLSKTVANMIKMKCVCVCERKRILGSSKKCDKRFSTLLLIDYLSSDNTNVSKSVLFSQQQKPEHTPII